MTRRTTTYTVFSCDQCGKEQEMDNTAGTASNPPGWRTIQPALRLSETDWFCSWECVSAFALQQQQEAKQKAAARKVTVK